MFGLLNINAVLSGATPGTAYSSKHILIFKGQCWWRVCDINANFTGHKTTMAKPQQRKRSFKRNKAKRATQFKKGIGPKAVLARKLGTPTATIHGKLSHAGLSPLVTKLVFERH